MRKNELLILVILVVTAFGIIWYQVSTIIPPWSDEPRHLLAAQSLAVSGKPVLQDYASGYPLTLDYVRGTVITCPLAFLYKHGLSALIWARAIPLVFVLLTLWFWIAYLRYKGWLDGAGTALLAVLFLGQPMVLEQATYIRMYAPLGLVLSILYVCCWELKAAWMLRQYKEFAGLAILCLFCLCIPKIDSWQLQHLPQLLLALLLLNSQVWRSCVFFIRKPVWSLLFFTVMLWLGPMFVMVLNGYVHVMSKSWGIDIGSTYDTYWDNISGLIRFLLAANVALLGLRWISNKPDKQGFFRWLYLSGLLTGILLALFAPPRYIFFSRYFYLPIIALTVGFAGMCAEENLKPWLKRILIAGYLAVSICINFVNFHFDRSNLPVAMDWLKKNSGQHDVILYFNYFYGLDYDSKLAGKNVYLIKDRNVDPVIKFVSAPGIEHVYLLMADNYKFRNILFEKMTGRRRWAVANRVADYLDSSVSGQEVLNGLRLCDLKQFEPRQVIAVLAKLKGRHQHQPPLWKLDPVQEKIMQLIKPLLWKRQIQK